MNTPTEVGPAKENTLLNLVFNIILPVFVLNKVSKMLGENGPLIALLIAIALPLGYGLYDYLKNKKMNWVSVLGLANVLVTGGFAVIKLQGIWFAVKEAAFPLIMGIGVYISAFSKKPFYQNLFWNEAVLNIKKIQESITLNHRDDDLKKLFKRATLLFSVSFLISSILNFWLASRIFVPLEALDEVAKANQLNEQIAKMTWQGYIVIALPMMLFMLLLLWYTLKQLQKISGLKLDDLLNADQAHSSVK